METSSLARQVESVERSVAFLRREQLALLHGLHLEILSLQKRCAELTRELNTKSPGRTQAEIEEEEELLEARCRDAAERLEEQQRALEELRMELSHKGALVGALRASLKDKERRFLDELKHRGHRSAVLGAELQKQTEAAAYLSLQLHVARQKLHLQQRPHAVDRPPAPSPPPTAPLAGRPKRRGHKLAAQVRAERARECVPRERVTGPEEPTAMPDPALFLHPRRHRPHSRSAHRQQRREKEGAEPPEDREGHVTRSSNTAPTSATETEAE